MHSYAEVYRLLPCCIIINRLFVLSQSLCRHNFCWCSLLYFKLRRDRMFWVWALSNGVTADRRLIRVTWLSLPWHRIPWSFREISALDWRQPLESILRHQLRFVFARLEFYYSISAYTITQRLLMILNETGDQMFINSRTYKHFEMKWIEEYQGINRAFCFTICWNLRLSFARTAQDTIDLSSLGVLKEQ